MRFHLYGSTSSKIMHVQVYHICQTFIIHLPHVHNPARGDVVDPVVDVVDPPHVGTTCPQTSSWIHKISTTSYTTPAQAAYSIRNMPMYSVAKPSMYQHSRHKHTYEPGIAIANALGGYGNPT